MGQWKYWLGKLQAPTDPGLSTAQLMLTNDDLKPGKNMYKALCISSSILSITLYDLHHIQVYFTTHIS